MIRAGNSCEGLPVEYVEKRLKEVNQLYPYADGTLEAEDIDEEWVETFVKLESPSRFQRIRRITGKRPQ